MEKGRRRGRGEERGGKEKDGEDEEAEQEERKRRKGRESGRARRSPAHPAFPTQHLEESLVLVVLEERGGCVLLNPWSSATPRPASHRAPTHGASCPCLLRLGSGCRVRRGTSAVNRGTGSAKNHKGNKSSRGPWVGLASSSLPRTGLDPPPSDWGPPPFDWLRPIFWISSGPPPPFLLPEAHLPLTGSDPPPSDWLTARARPLLHFCMGGTMAGSSHGAGQPPSSPKHPVVWA